LSIQIFEYSLRRYITYYEKTFKDKKKVNECWNKTLYLSLSTKEFNVINALNANKSFEDMAKFLAKEEGKAVKPDSLRRRAKRACENFKTLFEQCLKFKDIKNK